MKHKIYLLSLLLFSSISLHATIYNGNYGANVTWILDTESGEISFSGTGAMSGSCPYSSYKSYITTAIINSGVTSIGNSAFSECTELTSVTIPSSVTIIDEYSFYGCNKLSSITIPSSVTRIRSASFYGCTNLYSITIPNSVTQIDGSAFENCTGLTSATLTNSTTNIGYRAFFGCSKLSSFVIPNGVTLIRQATFQGCSKLKSITVPSSVIRIEKDAFNGCTQLNAVHISDLAAWCNIEFNYNNSSVNYYSNPLWYAHHLFLNGTEITNLIIPNGVTSIRNYAFSKCNGILSVTIPNSVTSIGDYAFYVCEGLSSISIPNSVTSIGKWAFCSCDLGAIIIPNKVTTIEEGVFSACNNLTSVTIPDGVSSIGTRSFQYCNGLTSIVLPNSVITVGERAFMECQYLESFAIGNGVTSFGESAFGGCLHLSLVTCLATTPPAVYSSGVFYNVPVDAILYVPNSSTSTYAAASGWSRFAGYITGVATTTIGSTGWATFSCDAPLDLEHMTASTGEVAAYYASSVSGDIVTMTQTTTSVAVNEGLMLKGSDGATIVIPVVASGTSIPGNKLVGCSSGATITSSTPNYANIYVLANNEGTAQFENIKDYVDANTSLFLGAGKAYLNLAGISLAPDALRFELEENNATQLESLAENENVVKFFQNGQLYILRDGITYDTMGRIVR